MGHRGGPGDAAAPVVPGYQRGLCVAFADQAGDVGGQLVGVVGCGRRRAWRTSCSRACRVRPPGIPPPRAVRSAAASRARTRGSRTAGRPAAPPRPRRNAAARRPLRNPHEARRSPGRWLCSLPPPWVVSGRTLRSRLLPPREDTGFVRGTTPVVPGLARSRSARSPDARVPLSWTARRRLTRKSPEGAPGEQQAAFRIRWLVVVIARLTEFPVLSRVLRPERKLSGRCAAGFCRRGTHAVPAAKAVQRVVAHTHGRTGTTDGFPLSPLAPYAASSGRPRLTMATARGCAESRPAPLSTMEVGLPPGLAAWLASLATAPQGTIGRVSP